MLLGLYLALVILAPLALGALVVTRGLPRTTTCPSCAGDTLRLRSRLLALVNRRRGRHEIHARWCPGCGWRGAARIRRPGCDWLAPLGSTGTETADAPGIEIRRLTIAGEAWRVRLQCWSGNGDWYGRLLFISPAGRTMPDDASLLTGQSPVHVLSQVLSLPDRALARRIRRAAR